MDKTNHKIIKAGGNLWRPLVQNLTQSRVSSEITAGCSGPHSAGSWNLQCDWGASLRHCPPGETASPCIHPEILLFQFMPLLLPCKPVKGPAPPSWWPAFRYTGKTLFPRLIKPKSFSLPSVFFSSKQVFLTLLCSNKQDQNWLVCSEIIKGNQ